MSYLSLTEDVYDVLACEYESRIARSPFYLDQRRCEQTLIDQIAPRCPRGRALDIGCGPGYGSGYLASLGFEVVAADRSASMRAIAAETLAKHPGCRVLDSDARDLASIPGEFALIISFGSVINHLASEQELRSFAQGISSKLAPGGTALIGVDNLLSLDSLGWLVGVRSVKDFFSELFDLFQRVSSGLRGTVHRNHWLLRSNTGTLELPLTYFPRNTLLSAFRDSGLKLADARGANIIASLSPGYLATSEFTDASLSAVRPGWSSRMDARLGKIFNRVATYSVLALDRPSEPIFPTIQQ